MFFSFLNWDRFPFLRYTIFLIVGIIIADNCIYTINLASLAVIICSILGAYITAIHVKHEGIIGLLGIAFLGFIIGQSLHKNIPKPPKHIAIMATVEAFLPNRNAAKVIVNINSLVINQHELIPFQGKTILYLTTNFKAKIGDQVMVVTTLRQLPKAANPEAFDKNKYWKNQGVYYQGSSKKYGIIKPVSTVNIFQIAFQTQQYCDKIFKKTITDQNEYAIVTAMILGIRSELDLTLKNAYSNAGIIHVIAISGLHISLFFLIVNGILSKFIRSKKTIAICILIFIWFYGLVTGLSPSVIRAVLMHSIILVGQLLHKRANNINNICFSAFLLLCIKPEYLHDIGFQLSYLAVLGIVGFDSMFDKKNHFNHYLLQQVWETAKLTLIAQVATVPILLYHFNQLSISFFIANILVIPISTLIIWLSCAVLFSSVFSNVISNSIGYITLHCTKTMNWIALKIGHWEYSSLQHITFNWIECLLLYCFIVGTLCYFKYKTQHLWRANLLIVILLFTARVVCYQMHDTQKIMLINAFNNKSSVNFINGHIAQNYTNNTLNDYEQKCINKWMTKKWVTLQEHLKVPTHTNHHFKFQNIDLLLIHHSSLPVFKQKIDYVLICNNVRFNWQKIVNHYPKATIIVDLSNRIQYANRIEKYLLNRNIKVHNMYKHGAFVYTFP
jgi:competence protein ComEC